MPLEQLGRGALGDDASFADDHHLVTAAFGGEQVVGGDQHAVAGAGGAFDDGVHQDRGFEVEAAQRFVEHQQPRTVRRGQHELQLALHAVGVVAHVLVEVVGQVEDVEQVVGGREVEAGPQMGMQHQQFATAQRFGQRQVVGQSPGGSWPRRCRGGRRS